ncbi:MAG: hypothetical protein ACK2TU_06885 [Anaerolineales bacterium]
MYRIRARYSTSRADQIVTNMMCFTLVQAIDDPTIFLARVVSPTVSCPVERVR